jgi:hypothetical protein
MKGSFYESSNDVPFHQPFATFSSFCPNILSSTPFKNIVPLNVGQISTPQKVMGKFIVLQILIFTLLDSRQENE